MRIVVAGATGFIGAALTRRFLADGHSVVALSRNPGRIKAREVRGLTAVQWDGKTVGDWVGEIDGAGAVVNFAGELIGGRRWTPAVKAAIISSRIDSTRALVMAIGSAARRPPVLVSASGVGYYGPLDDEEVSEDHTAGQDFLARLCVAWEAEAARARQHGVRVITLRCGIVLGHDGGAIATMAIPFRLFAGGTVGTGIQWVPWIHRDDLLEVAVSALTNPSLTGAVNVVAPESARMRDLCRALGRVLHRPCWLPVPGFVLRLVFGEMATILLTGQRVIPSLLLRAGFTFRYPQLETALSNVLRS